MVITVNGSCGLTAVNFNSAIDSVANSIGKHPLAIAPVSRSNCLTSSLNTGRSTFTQLPIQTSNSIQTLNSTNQQLFNHHAESSGTHYHPYLSGTGNGNVYNRSINSPVNFFLNDELNVLTNMYQNPNLHNQNQISTQLDLNTLQTNHQPHHSHLDHHHTLHHSNHLDQLHLNTLNHTGTLNGSLNSSLNNLTHHHSQTNHLFNDQNASNLHSLNNNQFNHHNDDLHDSSLNAPELSYDFTKLITSSSKDCLTNSLTNNLINRTNQQQNNPNRTKRKCNSDENELTDDSSPAHLQQQTKSNHKSTSQTVFHMLSNQQSNQINSSSKKFTSKDDNLNKNLQLDQRSNLSPNRTNCSNSNQNKFSSFDLINTIFLNNEQNQTPIYSNPNSPSSVKNEFIQQQNPSSVNRNTNQQTDNRMTNTGLLAISTIANSALGNLTNSSSTSANLTTNTSNNIGNNSGNLANEKVNCVTNRNCNSSTNTPITNLINSASDLASSTGNLQQYSQQTDNLKLQIKIEPDEQQQDFTSSDSIYSPGTLSNSTELTGYHSPNNNNLIFGHMINGKV